MNFNLDNSFLAQTLVEFAEHIAITKDNARWDRHNFAYAAIQSYLFSIVAEYSSFSEFPMAFESGSLLRSWANTTHMNVSKVKGFSGKHALSITGTAASPPLFDGVPTLWVKATYTKYRQLMLVWLEQQQTALEPIHFENAETYCSGVIHALEQRVVRKHIAEPERLELINEFRRRKTEFERISKLSLRTVNEENTIKLFDLSLDADHVINKESLKQLTDAWVLLVPVISGTNRSFGSVIEKFAVPFSVGRGRIDLDPITALKLLTPALPRDQSRATSAYKDLMKRLIGCDLNIEQTLNRSQTVMANVLNGTAKSWVR